MPERRIKIRFRSGRLIDGVLDDDDMVDDLLRALGENVGGVFGANPKLLLSFGNGPVLVDRREIEYASAFETDKDAPDA
jgi:hypothetical protein